MHFFAMDDITFYKPVEIGDILTFDANITYTSQQNLLPVDESQQIKYQSFIQVSSLCVVSPSSNQLFFF
jgi:hypothetical protein